MLDNEKFKALIGISENYEMPEKLMKILENQEERESMFTILADQETDMSYDWFTDVYQQEHGDRDALKQDFTPLCLTECVAGLVGAHGSRHADICAGTGGLTIAAWNKNPDRYYYCEEFSKRTIPVLLLNFAIRNMCGQVVHVDALTGEVFAVYDLVPGLRFSSIRAAPEPTGGPFDAVVMNPPYSMPWPDVDQYRTDARFADYGVPPKKAADYAFILHGLHKLQRGGRLWAIVPHGVLFRGGRELEIRKQLLECGNIDTVIGVPNKLFLNTQIPVCLIGFGSGGCKSILMADASNEYEEAGKQNRMTREHIERIWNCCKNRQEEKRYSSIVPIEKIRENDYNLNIPRYVSTYIPEPVPDLIESLDELIQIEQEIEDAEYGFYDMMQQLTGTTEESEYQMQQAREKWKRMLIMKYGTA